MPLARKPSNISGGHSLFSLVFHGNTGIWPETRSWLLSSTSVYSNTTIRTYAALEPLTDPSSDV